MRICRLRTCDGRSVNRFSRTTKVICDQAFLPAKTGSTPCCRLPGHYGTVHTPQARSFTNRKRRKSSRPIYDAVSSLEEHEEADKLTLSLLACEVITRMLSNWAEYFGDTHVEAHHTLICVPLNCIQVKTSLVIDSPSVIK